MKNYIKRRFMFSFQSNLALKNVKLGRTPLLTFVLIQNVKSPEAPLYRHLKARILITLRGPMS